MSLPFPAGALAEIADAAAALARRAARRPLDVARKADRSPVTAVDHEVNAHLERALTSLLPGSGWLSEETADDPARLARPFVWIVDPIDGTEQLLRGVPELAVSIGLAEAGRVVAAAVVNPMTGERGVWVDGAPAEFKGLLPRPAAATLRTATAIVSRSESRAGELIDLWDLAGATRAVGSVAYKLLRVAAGADDLTFSIRPKHEWDLCGGVGLIQGAGRVYLRLDGKPTEFNRRDPRVRAGAVAGPEPLAGALREAINARRDRTLREPRA